MRRITKKINTITKIALVAILMVGVSVNTYAQKGKKAKKEEVVKRPVPCGHAATAKFVDSSFDVYERNRKVAAQLSDVKGNAGDAAKIKNDLEVQLKEVGGLLGQSKDVMAKAKTITPKTNATKAVKSVKAAVKALTATKDAIPAQLAMIKKQSGK